MFWSVIALAIGFALLLHVGVEKPVGGPMKRGLVRGLNALQSYASVLRVRARQ